MPAGGAPWHSGRSPHGQRLLQRRSRTPAGATGGGVQPVRPLRALRRAEVGDRSASLLVAPGVRARVLRIALETEELGESASLPRGAQPDGSTRSRAPPARSVCAA